MHNKGCHNLGEVLRAIRIEAFESARDILSLSTDWEDSFGEKSRSVPFLQPRYVALWSRVLGESAEPRVITVWKGRNLVGYAPLMVTSDPLGPFSIKTLKFIGNNAGSPGDILYADIVTSGPEEEVVRAVLSHAIATWRFSKWDFGYLRPSSLTSKVIRELLGEDYLRFPQTQSFVTLDLPSDWDSYLMMLSRNTRQSLGRLSRKLERVGYLDLRVDDHPSMVVKRVRELIENHYRWRTGTPQERWFGDEPVHEFLTSSAELLASQGRFLAFSLELDGTPIAWNAGAFDGTRYFEQILSYDQGFSTHSPGMILSMYLLRHLLSTDVHQVELGSGMDLRKQRLGGKPTTYQRTQGYLGLLRMVGRIRRFWTRRSVPS